MKVGFISFAGLAVGILLSAGLPVRADEAAASASGSPGSVSAKSAASAQAQQGPIRSSMSDPNRPPNAAAVVDGHVIELDQVQAACLRDFGPRIVDEMIQDYVIDREAKKQGIHVTPREIDDELAKIKKEIAPATIDRALAAHHQTMDMLKDDIRQQIERRRLLWDKVKPAKMARCREIFIKFQAPDVAAEKNLRSEGDALKIVDDIRKQLDAGASFDDLAKKYSEDSYASKGGDVGVVFSGVHVNDAVVNAALQLKSGEFAKSPVRIFDGYYLIQTVSESGNHPKNENEMYADAESVYRDQQTQFLIGGYLYGLIQQAHVTYYVHD